MSDVKLTDAEREQLRGLGQGQVPSAVETIVAAREAAARAEALSVAAVSLQRIVDYWDGRPLRGHGDHIYAHLVAVLEVIDADAAHNEQATA